MARFAKRRLPDGAKILDVGCGVGANAFWLHDEGYDVAGFDQSVEALRQLERRRRIDRFDDDGSYWQNYRLADVTHLPYCDSVFDAAIDACCLQHVEDIGAALKEVRRVLMPGGWFFSVFSSLFHSAKAFPENIHYKTWSAYCVELHWRAGGFDVVSIFHAHYQDEIHGDIGHWLVTAKKG